MKLRRLIGLLTIVALALTSLGATWARTHQATALSPKLDIGLLPLPPATPPLRTASPRTLSVGSAKAKYLVLFVIDGGRPDYLSVPNIPHIRALIDHGTTFSDAWAGILESETPSGHAAIGTGAAPREDGLLSFGWANSDNITVNLFNPANVMRGDMERIMAKAGAPSIASLVHGADPNARVVAMSGHKYYAADAIGGPHADMIMFYSGRKNGTYGPTAIPGHVPPQGILNAPSVVGVPSRMKFGAEDHLVMNLAMTTFRRVHEKVALINLPQFDWPLGHIRGADRDPKDVRSLMQGFDRDLGRLEDEYRKAGVLDQTLFVIAADHGFAPIYHQVTQPTVEHAIEAAGGSIVSDTFHTAGYVWLRNDNVAAAAAENIAKLQNPYIQSVYFKETIPGGFDYVRASGPELFRAPGVEAANQYLLNSFNGPTAPDIVVLFTEDTASLPGGEANWKGDHGGADWESQHIPLVFSGPGVRSGYVSSHPARLMDIAPTALTLMGISPTGMTGVPLADAMTTPKPDVLAAETAQGSALRPIVHALQAEAKAELAGGR